MKRFRPRSGFTLVELLVVMTILALLVALLLPAVQAAREAARRMQCGNNLKQMGLAMHNYSTAWNEYFPPGSPGGFQHGLFSLMLPYLEQAGVYDQLDMSSTGNTMNDEANHQHRYTPVACYVCPSWPYPSRYPSGAAVQYPGALTTYQGVAGAYPTKGPVTASSQGNIPHSGLFGWGFVRAIGEVTDGLSNTLAIGEFVQIDVKKPPSWSSVDYSVPPGNVRPWMLGGYVSPPCPWTCKVLVYPLGARVSRLADGILYNYLPHGSFHPGGGHFLLADGGVVFLSNSISFTVYQDLGTCNGGEPVTLP